MMFKSWNINICFNFTRWIIPAAVNQTEMKIEISWANLKKKHLWISNGRLLDYFTRLILVFKHKNCVNLDPKAIRNKIWTLKCRLRTMLILVSGMQLVYIIINIFFIILHPPQLKPEFYIQDLVLEEIPCSVLHKV